jgi:uncharacterized protein (DUF433 family)
MNMTQRITAEPGKRGGRPCIRGMRITVRDILEYLGGGMSVEELLLDFPELTIDDIRACLNYAAAQDNPSVFEGGVQQVDKDEFAQLVESLGWLLLSAEGWDGDE